MVGTVDGLAGVTLQDTATNDSGQDNITLVANSPLTVDNAVTNNDGGNITLTAAADVADPVAESEPNLTISGAQNLDPEGWNLNADALIEESTTIPHITINGTGDDTFDMFSFTANNGDRGIFDIDGSTFDTTLALLDSSGTVIAFNDDDDEGDGGVLPSRIDFTFGSSGTFFLFVDQFAGNAGVGAGVPAGETYDLHVSVENHALGGGVGAATDDVVLNANVTASGGNGSVTINAANDILQNSGAVSAAGSGAIDFNAGTDTTDGVITMADGTSASSGSGPVTLDADGNITISSVSTTGDVTATSTGGGILDGGDSGTDVTGSSLALRAATGIGSGDALETAISTLAAGNTSSGNIEIDNSVGGLLTLGTVDGLSGVTNTAPGGTIVITNASPLTAATNVTASGNVALTAIDSAAAGDDLTVNSGVTVQSTGGDVTLRGGDDVELQSGSTVAAAGKVTIEGDFGDADPGVGSTIDILGTLTTVTQADILGEADHDHINLDPDATTGTLRIDGQGGDDSTFIQLGNLGGQVDVDDQAGAGTDDLTLNATAAADTLTVEATQTTLATPWPSPPRAVKSPR